MLSNRSVRSLLSAAMLIPSVLINDVAAKQAASKADDSLPIISTLGAPVPAANPMPDTAAIFAAERALTYRTGTVPIGDGLATLKLPEGYRYLDPAQSEKVISEFWGNPPGQKTLGMIFAPGVTPLLRDSWGVIIGYDEDGYVKDDDAEKIDYAKLLKDMQASAKEANKERVENNFAPVELIGFAEPPYYDKAAHKLHWAKELEFGGQPEHTLNYNIRILGRKGVLVLNAVASITQLERVKAGMKPVLDGVEFESGHRYADFNPNLDKVATYGIAGLVAGGILAKVGFFKILIGLLIAAKKFIVLGFAALMVWLKKFFGGPSAKKEVKDEVKKPEEVKKEISE